MLEKLMNTYEDMHPVEKAAIICTAIFFCMFNAAMVHMLIMTIAEGLI